MKAVQRYKLLIISAWDAMYNTINNEPCGMLSMNAVKRKFEKEKNIFP